MNAVSTACRQARLWGAVVVCSLALGGCARSPATGGGGQVTDRLVIDLWVQGVINDSFYYYVAFDDDGDSSDGPIPVISSPWFNGWGTGSFTLFVEYHLGQFRVFSHVDNGDGTFTETDAGPPFEFRLPAGGERRQLSFTLDYKARFPTDPDTLDINFITTNELILDPNLQIENTYDALGPTGNDYLSIQTQTNATFSNVNAAIREMAGDVALDDLDLVDWRIQVLRQ